MDEKEVVQPMPIQEEKQPDEQGGLNIRGHIKITDPESGEVFLTSSDA